MPLFTTSIQNQEQSASAGVKTFPELGGLQKGGIIGDDFNRESLEPTNAYDLYTVATTGTGTATINAVRELLLTTSAAIGDDESVRTSGYTFRRLDYGSTRSMLTLDVYFRCNETTSIEGFIGLLGQNSAVTALPTTTRHLGIFWDVSASPNFFLSSSNGTTQVTTDTEVAITTNIVLLRVIWNGNDTAKIQLFTGTDPVITTLSKEVNVTSFGASSNMLNYNLHFFLQTEALAARNLIIEQWSVKSE